MRKQRAIRWGGSGLVILLAGAALCLFLRTQHPATTSEVAVLDLSQYSAERGETTNRPIPLQLSRSAKRVVVYLPLGSKEDTYELAIFKDTGEPLVEVQGVARRQGHLIALRVDVSLSSIPAGQYSLALRRNGFGWVRYPLQLR